MPVCNFSLDWGDLFINAALLYDPQAVFLDRYYGESGNVLFDGGSSCHGPSRCRANRNGGLRQADAYKTGIYWASRPTDRYLVRCYQKGNLIFEAAIPLQGADTLAMLEKLNAVNEKPGPDIAEWQQATALQLRPTDT